MTKRIGLGNDIDVTNVRIKSQEIRARFGLILFSASGLAIGVAAIHGFLSGDFAGLNNVWMATGPIVGLVTGYYFGNGNGPDTS